MATKAKKSAKENAAPAGDRAAAGVAMGGKGANQSRVSDMNKHISDLFDDNLYTDLFHARSHDRDVGRRNTRYDTR